MRSTRALRCAVSNHNSKHSIVLRLQAVGWPRLLGNQWEARGGGLCSLPGMLGLCARCWAGVAILGCDVQRFFTEHTKVVGTSKALHLPLPPAAHTVRGGSAAHRLPLPVCVRGVVLQEVSLPVCVASVVPSGCCGGWSAAPKGTCESQARRVLQCTTPSFASVCALPLRMRTIIVSVTLGRLTYRGCCTPSLASSMPRQVVLSRLLRQLCCNVKHCGLQAYAAPSASRARIGWSNLQSPNGHLLEDNAPAAHAAYRDHIIRLSTDSLTALS